VKEIEEKENLGIFNEVCFYKKSLSRTFSKYEYSCFTRTIQAIEVGYF
jgi:hypothetical protein